MVDDCPTCVNTTDLEIYAHCPSPYRTSHLRDVFARSIAYPTKSRTVKRTTESQSDKTSLFCESTQLTPLTHTQLPKVLLPEQEITLTTQIASIEALVTEESDALAREKESVAEMLTTNRARIDELVTKLERLRKQVKPMEKVEKEDFGRAPKEEMEVDRDGDKEAGVQIKGEDGDVEVEY